MDNTTQDFIEKFHSLEGITIGERRKNLFILLNTKRHLHDRINFEEIVPKTTFEKSLHINILIYFRRTQDLLNILKSEDRFLIVKILNQRWFIEEAFKKVNGDQLVNEIFPTISFCTKARILSRLGKFLKNTQQADEYFEAVCAKYGLRLASKLLQSCSLELITNLIKTTRFELRPSQLLQIFKKYPSTIEEILGDLTTYKTSQEFCDTYKLVFEHIALNDPSLFIKLFETYDVKFTLSRKTTIKILNTDKDLVIREAVQYIEILHEKALARNLKMDFQKFYINLFPKSIGQFSKAFEDVAYWYDYHSRKYTGCLHRLLKYLSADFGYNFLKTSFQQVYGDELWEHPEFFTEKLIHILPLEDKEKWVNYKLGLKEDSEEQWVRYLGTEKSIPLLKKTISLTNGYKKRERLIQFLVDTCKINEDYDALLEVCKYILDRHRNDHITLREAFIRAVEEKFDIKQLDERYWNYFHELLQIFQVNKEQFYYANEYAYAYIYHRLLRNLPIKHHVKEVFIGNRDIRWEYFEEDKKFVKQYLLTVGELIPECFTDNDLRWATLSFLNALMKWNSKYPQSVIPIFSYPYAIEHLVKELNNGEDTFYYLDDVITYFIKMEQAEIQKSNWLDELLGNEKITLTTPQLIYLLKKDPELILRHLPLIFKRASKNWKYFSDPVFWYMCKYYTHLQLPENVINICLKKMKTEDEKENGDHDVVVDKENNYRKLDDTVCLEIIERKEKANSSEEDEHHNEKEIAYNDGEDTHDEKIDHCKEIALSILSYLLDSEKFLDLLKNYYPSDSKIDYSSKKQCKLYEKQKILVPCLANIIPPHLALEPILNFCKGDYLKLVQNSLYAIPHRVNEYILPNFLGKLLDNRTSIRKHSISLKSSLGSTSDVYNVLNRPKEIENNMTIRKLMFTLTFRHFCKKPDETVWELLKLNTNSVETKDEEMFDVLLQLEKIPPLYLTSFVTFVWKVLNEAPEENGYNKESAKTTILSLIDSKLISKLPSNFCVSIIEENFLTTRALSNFQNAVQDFSCRFISQTNSSKALDAVFKIIKQSCDTVRDDITKEKENRTYVTTFLKRFCNECMEEECQEILENFAQHWNTVFKPEDTFKEYLYLRFSLLQLEFVKGDFTIAKICENIVSVCDSLFEIYERTVIVILYDVLKCFTSRFLDSDLNFNNENLYDFIALLLESSKSSNCMILALYFISNNFPAQPTTSAVMSKYYKIVNALKNFNDPIVKIHLSVCME